MDFEQKKAIYLEYLSSRKEYLSKAVFLYAIYLLILLMNIVIIGNSLVDGIFSTQFIGNFSYELGFAIDMTLSFLTILINITWLRMIIKIRKNNVIQIDPFIKAEMQGYLRNIKK